jgi:hypothetical protein
MFDCCKDVGRTAGDVDSNGRAIDENGAGVFMMLDSISDSADTP